ncbi:hypothetical protein C5167_018765 [Papaver somniferum]|uniref:Uncharacterized protein n=1 Tax=Papaver somniferum TaxID=3469 RepID=A0A4Y7IN69_PAPSO|nr:hypothetical protein C5167_018765 [Papaver somniferum]
METSLEFWWRFCCSGAPTGDVGGSKQGPELLLESENLRQAQLQDLLHFREVLEGQRLWYSLDRAGRRESGEMCAMKEVTLFADDAKSRESAKQLEQKKMQKKKLDKEEWVTVYGCQ